MKYIIPLSLLVMLNIHSFADCNMHGLIAYPNNINVLPTTIFILEGIGADREVVRSLNEDYPVTLESENHSVKLNVLHLYEGGFLLTQVLLQPLEPLKPGNKYFIKIENYQNDNYLPKRWNEENRQYEPIYWEIIPGRDIVAPEFLSAPQLLNKSFIRYGCGPAVNAHFMLDIADDSFVYVQTEMVDIKNGRSTVYYLPWEKGEPLNVGHSMCFGAFFLEQHRKYKVRFRLMDLSGNSESSFSRWVTFVAPGKDD